jgi:polysaccharide export outer membrane protein
VTVLGAVAKPSVYPLDRPTTLLQVISLAGGPTATAGNTVTVVRPGKTSGAEGFSARGTTLNVDLAKLMEGKDPSMNILVQAGDSVSVSAAPVIYVVGAVMKPGGYVLQDPKSGMTILQAIAMAQGMTRVAAPKRSLIVRREGDDGDKSEKIPVNISQLMNGHFQDAKLHPNDILFIPESNMKKSLDKLGTVAMSAVNGMSIYGLGYRIR